MNNEKHPFMYKYAKDRSHLPYLGSDGLPMEESYALYIKKCEEFKRKAKKYAKENTCSKNSMLHHFKYGYTGSEQLEEDVLLEREELKNHYRTSFDVTFFSADPNSMYECFSGKSKRIRVIRELDQFLSFNTLSNPCPCQGPPIRHVAKVISEDFFSQALFTFHPQKKFGEERNSEFSSDFEKKRGSWFTRYCILSRFIEVARKIILLNRLKKALATLRTLTPRQVKKLQPHTVTEGEDGDSNKELSLEDRYLLETKPCTCDWGKLSE